MKKKKSGNVDRKKLNNKKAKVIEHKNIKNSDNINVKNLVSHKKLKIIALISAFIFIALIVRIGVLQFIDGNYLKEKAYKQQSINQIISPKRGNIYDSTGKILALSSQVDTITINPNKIVDKNDDDEKTKELKEKVAKALSDIFELDYDEVFGKVNSNSSVETIIKKVDSDKVDKLKTWMSDNKISTGINIDEDTKRSYPYETLASQLIGFCGTDNQGLMGVELYWDDVLSGTSGKIVSSKDASQSEIPNSKQTYIAAENGSDITLTVDVNIQTIIEKYLKQAVEENSCSKGGNAVVMDPETGDILGMATYPTYNLNTPFSAPVSLESTWDSLDSSAKRNALEAVWRNKAISDTYEPGSTFKIITASVALEENITDSDVINDFVCTGYEDVSGTKIKCWRANPHGAQTLRQALMNSCNPAFIQLGKRIGVTTLYKYYQAFGFFNKTGVAISGEANKGIFFDLEKVRSVELATMSFGQRIKITPLQLVSAVSAIANDGVLMQPRIVKEIKNSETNTVTTIDPVEVRQVVSKSTSEKIKSMMESVVTDGTGKYAKIEGYSIGGKTGTSEPISGSSEDGYVASYIAISPVQNTKVCILLTLYDPHGSSHQGGQIAAPVIGQMLSEILPYLGVTSDKTNNSSDSESNSLVTVPDVTNKTVAEAKKVLEKAGFTVVTSAIKGNQNESLVSVQTPKPGVSLGKGAIIVLYESGNDARVSVTVPDLKEMTLAQAKNSLKSKNLNIQVEGSSGKVISQEISKDTSVEAGTVIKVILKEKITDAH